MLFIDRREKPRPGQPSNHDIIEQLGKYRTAAEIEFTVMHMDSADCRFEGHGEHGPSLVGCERKRLSDLINSMKDRRLAGIDGQLDLLSKEHDYIYLFVECMIRPGRDGEIEEFRVGRNGAGWYPAFGHGPGNQYAVNYRQVMNFLTTLELKVKAVSTGERLVVRRTATAYETASQYVSLWHWFNGKRWDQHHSHSQIRTNAVEVNGRRAAFDGIGPGAVEASELWKMAAQLPGVDMKAREVAEYFADDVAVAKGRVMEQMARATLRDWMSIPGIGQETAEKCMRVMRTGTSRISK